MSKFPRGSEWRRWDPHVHTPDSALANQFSTWDEYIDALETVGREVAALGVTDYCTIDGYKKVLEYRSCGRLQDFDFIFPNIEFRISPDVRGTGINIHILVDPQHPEHIEQIDRALRNLKFRYKGDPYACERSDLVRLAKAHDSTIQDEQAAFRQGVNLFKPSFDDFRRWYEEHGWLRTNSLIVLANSSNDGASGLSKDAGFSAVRDEMYCFSDLIFSATPNDRPYFLGEGSDTPEIVIAQKGSLKACIHGSDAHKESKLFNPTSQRYCWIQANPTFEGLRQLLHEPKDRVYIGPTPQQPINKNHIIESIEFINADKWFASPSILLNPGLVGIIGEKGTGKTALAEVIAYAAGAQIVDGSKSSFIQKAKRYLNGVQVRLNWANEHTSEAYLDQRYVDRLPEVRYLSQDFVEELCSQDLTGESLIRQIEEVVFSYIDETERLDASSFADLRRLKTENLTERKNDVKVDISSLNREICDLEDQIAERAEKVMQLNRNIENIAAINSQLSEMESAVNAEISQQAEQLTNLIQSKSDELSRINLRLNRLSTVRGKAQDFARSITSQFNELKVLLEEIGLSPEEVTAFKPNISNSRELPFERIATELEQNAKILRGDSENASGNGDSIADLNSKLATLREDLATDQKQRERLVQLQEQKRKLEADKQRLEREIDRIDTQLTASLGQKQEDRWSLYLSYFDTLSEEAKILEELYSPLEKIITDDPTGAKAGFELNVKQLVDQEAWIETGRALFDKRRSIPITDGNIVKGLYSSLFDQWGERNKAGIREGLEKLIQQFPDFPQGIDPLIVSHANRERVCEWLFSTDHVRLQYGLRYRGSDLTVLSPGTRGIVLLVLYLAMDRNDSRPLIIDQPEGNLDSSSIYESLVPFLRKAKQFRQVILVTHNPNLVVTTDADQVIVTTANREEGEPHPQITYTCGALEDAGELDAIRDQTVRLLEGGSTPFRMRESRYALSSLGPMRP